MTNKKRSYKLDSFDIVNIILLTILMLMVLIPFYYTIVISFMEQQEFIMGGFTLWANKPTIANYKDIVLYGGIGKAFYNSVVNTILGVCFSMFVTTTLAYGLSKKNYPGRTFIQNFVIFPMFFGGGLIPFFLTVKGLGLMNTRWAVIIPIGLSIFNAIILRNFFEQLPKDLEEAAIIDGASPLRIFIQIHLPLIKPALATIILFYAVDRWNEWFYSSLFLGDNDLWPMQVVLRQILYATEGMKKNIPPEARRDTFSEGIKAATVLLTMAPIMVVYPFLQKYFVKGIMIGAIKS
mgnify:CR=1 FL=1